MKPSEWITRRTAELASEARYAFCRDTAGITWRLAVTEWLDQEADPKTPLSRQDLQRREIKQERDFCYEALERWQRWAAELSLALGWSPKNTLPDDTAFRERVSAALYPLVKLHQRTHRSKQPKKKGRLRGQRKK